MALARDWRVPAPTDAKAIQDQTLQLGVQQPDVQWEHIEASIRYWRSHTGLVKRLNYPHCKVADTNDHYRHNCVEPTVVAARRKHLALLSAAIHKCGLKSATARALIAMYTMNDEGGGHIDPRAGGWEVCARRVDNLVSSEVPEVKPARGTMIVLLEVNTSERTQGWLPQQFDHGMHLLGEPLDKACKFQTHVVRLAMETDMSAARCRMIHPGGTTCISSRKGVPDKYAATLERTRRKHLPITRRVYMGPPTQRKTPLMRQ